MSDARFWSRVKKTGECWIWTGGKGDDYGKVSRTVNGKEVITSAHRFAYRDAKGEIPLGYVVRHLCHNRVCVRPEHLSIGTQADNVRDTSAAGRARNRWTGKLKGMQPGAAPLKDLP